MLSQKADKYTNTVGRTGIYACGESVSRHNSSELVVLFSLKQEASSSIGGYVHRINLKSTNHQEGKGDFALFLLYNGYNKTVDYARCKKCVTLSF